jgi:hypothetical protein
VDLNKTETGPTWILIDSISGMKSNGNVVCNNLVSNTVTIRFPGLATTSNNKNIGGSFVNYANYFVNVSNPAFPGNFDLRLKSTSPAIDAGINILAPLIDFDGFVRPKGVTFDVGAYEFQQGLTTVSTPTAKQLNSKHILHQTASGITIEQLSYANIQIYHINGQLLDNKNVYQNYSFELKKGIYILAIDGISSKFIKY